VLDFAHVFIPKPLHTFGRYALNMLKSGVGRIMRTEQRFAARRKPIRAALLSAALALAGCTTQQASERTPAPTATRQAAKAAGASAAGKGYLTQIRTTHGLPALAYDPKLERAALEQALYMARTGRMSHTTGFGRDFVSRIRGNGIKRVAAENIAYGNLDLGKLFAMWMNSQGHRRNMLNPQFSRFGLAYVSVSGSDWRYWALVVSG
jgi:uncharacterized protein YkwD